MIDPSATVVIRGDRGKSLKTFAIAAALAAGCAFSLAHGKDVLLSAMGALFFGLAALQGLFALVRPPKLVVDGEGLAWRGLRAWRVAWSDVERFRLMVLRRSSVVLIDYREGRVPAGAWARLRQPKAVPGALWMRPVEVQELLQGRLDLVRAADPNPTPPVPAGADALPQPAIVFPRVSIGLILALAIVFAAEVMFPITPGKTLQPSVMTLAGFGGLSRGLLLAGAGQWYRFVAAPLLHASLPHLIGNAFALFLAGRLLEGLVGRAWFVGIFAFGALTGGLGSLLLNSASTVSVGASGAIVALFAATYACSFHFQPSAGRSRLQSGAFAILVPTLLTLGKTADGMTIDVGDHLGGAIGGALLGLFLLRGWDRRTARPPRERLGLAFAVLGGVAVLGATWPAVSRHAVFARAATLVPDDVMPKGTTAIVDQAPTLLARYPDDPRLHLAAALRDLQANDGKGAQEEARKGLEDAGLFQGLLLPSVEASLWLAMGEALASEKADEAALAAYDKAAAADPTLPGIDGDRARLHFSQGMLGPALEEAKRLVARSPDDPAAWSLLGDLDFASTDLAGAVKAYDASDRLQPTQLAVRARGLSRFYAGDATGALEDLQRAATMDPKDLYGALWLDIVRRRQGLASSVVHQDLPRGDRDWPAPVISMFAGMIEPARVSAAVAAETPKPGEDHRCEVEFYAAELNRLQDWQAEAMDGFRKAAAECPPTFVETWMARAELAIASNPN